MRLKQFKTNLVGVTTGNLTVFFSYEQSIAFSLGSEIFCNTEKFSRTTSKHLKLVEEYLCLFTKINLNQYQFKQKLNETLAQQSN